MATQGERRRQAVSAVRSMRRVYRALDSKGEKIERELDRLIKRKTLISPDSLATLGRLLVDFEDQQRRVTKAYADLSTVIQWIPV